MEFRHPFLKKIMNNEITSLRITMISIILEVYIFYKYMNYKSRNNFGQILECKKM